MDGINSFFANIANFFGNISLPENYFKAGLIVVLIFVLILLTAYFGRFMNKSTVKGIFVGVFFGFLLTLVIEGFLLIAGRTVFTEMLGWDNAPKPVQTALDMGKEKLTGVLNEEQNSKDVITIMQSLNPEEIKKVKAIICEP